jgi:hypothetical protein
MSWDIYRIYGLFLPYFRKRRMRRFYDTFPRTREAEAGVTLLNVGGYPWLWRGEPLRAKTTIVNMHVPEGDWSEVPHVTFVKGDGCQLADADASFDLGYSNSVIEHLSTWENQQRFAAEISRVARALWVQTPAREFFVEPHLIAPIIHWLPKSWQRRLIRRGTIWGWMTKSSPAKVDELLAEVRLLSKAEMQKLFPDCEVHTERCLLWPKAYVAIRRARP